MPINNSTLKDEDETTKEAISSDGSWPRGQHLPIHFSFFVQVYKLHCKYFNKIITLYLNQFVARAVPIFSHTVYCP